MNYYLIFIGLIIMSIANVAWATFLIMSNGLVFPLFLVYLWVVNNNLGFSLLAGAAFLGGLIIDLLGPRYLGTHSLVFLVCILVIYLIENKFIKNKFVAKVISLVVSIVIYFIMISYL